MRAASMLIVLLSLAFGAAATTSEAAGAESAQPNIIMITADDMRYGDLATMTQTQALFHERGIELVNAFSTNPLCCPARAVLLTGQYNHNNGIRNNLGRLGGYDQLAHIDNTLPAWLQQVGYHTGFVGKMLNGYEVGHDNWGGDKSKLRDDQVHERTGWTPIGPTDRQVPKGWTEWHASYHGLWKYGGWFEFQHKTSGFSTLEESNRTGFKTTRDRYRTSFEGDMVNDLVENFSKDAAPFFIWWSPLAPHNEYRGNDYNVEEYNDQDLAGPRGTVDSASGAGWCAARPHPTDELLGYRPDERTYPKVSAPTAEHSPRTRANGRAMKKQDFLDSCGFGIRKQHELRTGSLQSLDREIGRLFQTLDKLEIADNTVVVFASDNGFLLGEHWLWGKRWGYAESLRVPLLLTGPDIPAGQTREMATGLVDLPHTFLSYATNDDVGMVDLGDRWLDGVNLRRLWTKPNWRPQRTLYIEGFVDPPQEIGEWNPFFDPDDLRMYEGVRTSRYTLMKVFSRDRSSYYELYDRLNDPQQQNNLLFPPDQVAETDQMVFDQLQQRLEQLRSCKPVEASDCTRSWSSAVPSG